MLSIVTLGLLSHVAVAEVHPTEEERFKQWIHEGKMIFKQLGINHYQLLFEGRYFAMPKITWVFQEKGGFSQLLTSLEKAPKPFSELHVLPGQLLFSNSQNSDYKSIILWVKRQQDQAYSGALSFMQNDDKTMDTQFESTLSVLPWLPTQSRLLLDMEMPYPENTRQWIYLLPFSIEEAQRFMQKEMQKHHWIPMKSVYPGMQAWQKEQQQLMYQLNDVEGNTTLFLMKKRSE